MNRQERRRRERAEARAGKPIAVVTEGGVYEEHAGAREMPPKVPGKHRWIATALYTLQDEWVSGAWDPAVLKFMDHENRIDLMIGCWDCEKALGQITADSVCDAPG